MPNGWPRILIGVPEELNAAIEEGDIKRPAGIFMQIGQRGEMTRQLAKRMGMQWRQIVKNNPQATAFAISRRL